MSGRFDPEEGPTGPEWTYAIDYADSWPGPQRASRRTFDYAEALRLADERPYPTDVWRQRTDLPTPLDPWVDALWEREPEGGWA